MSETLLPPYPSQRWIKTGPSEYTLWPPIIRCDEPQVFVGIAEVAGTAVPIGDVWGGRSPNHRDRVDYERRESDESAGKVEKIEWPSGDHLPLY